jgi:hypothetical protein
MSIPCHHSKRSSAARSSRTRCIALAGVVAIALSCERPTDPVTAATRADSPPAAEGPFTEPRDIPQNLERFRLDHARPRHASDGGGRSWIRSPVDDEGRTRLVVGSRVRFELEYEVGPLGIAVGGEIQFLGSHFWGWDPPQIGDSEAAGYVRFEDAPLGSVLEPRQIAPRIVGARVRGRALRAGERVRIVYGAGPRRARVDRFAEREASLWLAVDGDGDGVREIVEHSPTLELRAGPPAQLRALLPTTARPGQDIALRVAVLDAAGNARVELPAADLELEIALEDGPGEGLTLPARLALAGTQTPEGGPSGLEGGYVLLGRALAPGVYRATVRLRLGDRVLSDLTNPLVVRAGIDPVLWADLHGHSNLSDGTGTPEDYFRYARSIAGLDVAALTDHDHWGTPFLDASPARWARIRSAVRAAHDPGRFVALLGYEWTSWLHGHRHVLHFADDGPLFSSFDPRTEAPPQLWDALRDLPALTFAHHSAGDPVPVDWRFPPDPQLEPVTEITSGHGSSEAADTPARIAGFADGNSVRDALAAGYRLGFIGSGDSHDGHPGLGPRAEGVQRGGLAALVGSERRRESVLATLRARRVYATNGERLWLEVRLDGAPAGSVLEAASKRRRLLTIDFATRAAVDRIDVIRGGAVLARLPGAGRREGHEEFAVAPFEAGEVLYVRLVEEVEGGGGVAWSSPFFFE